MTNVLIFTDLDGTLLDPKTYSATDSVEALTLCLKRGIEVIPVTSKTLSECRYLARGLELGPMVIFENGGGLIDPDGELISLGRRYENIRSALYQLQVNFPLRGFGDMSVDEIAQRTGLTLHAAALARERQFTEPFVYESIDTSALMEAAKRLGLTIETGNRFFHLMSASQSKGQAICLLAKMLEERNRTKFTTIGVGDSPNDISMLRVTNYSIFVGWPDRLPRGHSIPHLRVTAARGPTGWSEGVMAVLSEIDHPIGSGER